MSIYFDAIAKGEIEADVVVTNVQLVGITRRSSARNDWAEPAHASEGQAKNANRKYWSIKFGVRTNSCKRWN
jgi:hypothetical protein